MDGSNRHGIVRYDQGGNLDRYQPAIAPVKQPEIMVPVGLLGLWAVSALGMQAISDGGLVTLMSWQAVSLVAGHFLSGWIMGAWPVRRLSSMTIISTVILAVALLLVLSKSYSDSYIETSSGIIHLYKISVPFWLALFVTAAVDTAAWMCGLIHRLWQDA